VAVYLERSGFSPEQRDFVERFPLGAFILGTFDTSFECVNPDTWVYGGNKDCNAPGMRDLGGVTSGY